MATILVQISDRKWTMQALNLACAMARNTHSRLVLVHLMQVRSPYLLGSEYGVELPTYYELEAIKDYGAVAEDYGLEAMLQPMQYSSFSDALVQVAESRGASVVFAHVPASLFSLWHKAQVWYLRRQLKAHGCQLYTLEDWQQTEEWTQSVTVKA